MKAGNSDDLIFSATLTPHRSLGRRGFGLLMAAIGVHWIVTGGYFWSIGAWPVFGFLGLDVVALFLAFLLNYRAARAMEEVEVSRETLLIRRIAPNGRAQEFRFNPHWARLELEIDDERRVTRILVRSRQAVQPVGTFLNPEDRTSFARALGAAVSAART